MLRVSYQPWPVWLSGLIAGLWTKGSLVRFPVRAHTWVVGQVPGGGSWEATTHWCFPPSLSASFPYFLKKNKLKNIKKTLFFWGLDWRSDVQQDGVQDSRCERSDPVSTASRYLQLHGAFWQIVLWPFCHKSSGSQQVAPLWSWTWNKEIWGTQ